MADNNFRYVPQTTDSEGYVTGGYSRWDCTCGNEIRRYRGCGEQDCSECGQSYNASGQRLRNDWRGNSSNYDDDVSDLEGFELQHAGDW